MSKLRNTLSKVRQICLQMPDATETEKWGKPHFCVNKKIFAGCGDEDGKFVVGFKLEMEHAKKVVKMPGFWKAPYVGDKGWVSMDLTENQDWKLVKEFVRESYRLIAPATPKPAPVVAEKTAQPKPKAVRKKK